MDTRNMSGKLSLDYIEYGKVFLDHEASDFQILEYSSDEILEIAGRQRCQNFMEAGLMFPQPASKSPFAAKVGNISVCFIKPSDNYFLFIQVQRREEGELARFLKKTARLNRPFNQVRFVYIDLKKSQPDIKRAIIEGLGIYSALLYTNKSPELVEVEFSLRDFRTRTGNSHKPALIAMETATWVENNSVKGMVNAFGECFNRFDFLNPKIQIKGINATSIKEKLNLLDAVQILVWPICDVLSFSLDYISERSDINLQVYDVPKLDKPDLGDMNNVEGTFYCELIELRKLYLDLFVNDSFIRVFRSYFSETKNILDSAEVSSLKLGNKPRHVINVLEDPKLFNAICKFGDLDIFIENSALESLASSLLSSHKSEISPLGVETSLRRISNGASELRQDTLIQIIDNFWELINNSVSLKDSLTQSLSYKQIANFPNTEIVKIFFLYKTANDQNPGKDWLVAYKLLSVDLRDKLRKNLVQIFESNPKLIFELRVEARKEIYDEILDYYFDVSNGWDNYLIWNWVPNVDVSLDKIISKRIRDNDESIYGFAVYLIRRQFIEGFGWLLGSIYLNEKILEELRRNIVQLSKSPLPVYFEFYDAVSARMVNGGDPEEEKEFFINMFPISDRCESWLKQRAAKFDVQEIRNILDLLLKHPQLEEGIEKNPHLRILLKPNKFLEVYEEFRLGKLVSNIFYSTLLGLDQQRIEYVLNILINDLPSSSANIALSYIARNKLYKKIPLSIALSWLDGTKGSLRSIYIIDGVDKLNEYLIGLDSCDDELLWKICVLDYKSLVGESGNISWNSYISNLPLYNNRSSNYGKYVLLVKAIGNWVGSPNALHRRLIVCRDLVVYQNRKLTLDVKTNFETYKREFPDDQNLNRELQKALDAEDVKLIHIAYKKEQNVPQELMPSSGKVDQNPSVIKIGNEYNVPKIPEHEKEAADAGYDMLTSIEILVAFIISTSATLYVSYSWPNRPNIINWFAFYFFAFIAIVSAFTSFVFVIRWLIKTFLN
jgi:hypothetical protein